MDFKGKKFGRTASIVALVIILLAPVAPWPVSLVGEIIGVGLLIAACVVIFRDWRCPHCHTLMPIRGFYEPEYCPSCGKRIEPYRDGE
ncbi:hypothetical protein [Intestinibacillus massiliensis]|uniref:hypothetical protein n=1 Tax=Intestinibacillus massiliensis TaxID=1871029 RepID=UPI000B35D01B|nr:hypothetical protein [Intestinibacillus massiliensis]